MKVLLVTVNSKYVHSSLGVWYLKASAKEYSKNVHILESTIKENKDILIEKIVKEKPNILGFSSYIWNISFLKEILPKIRECLPETIIYLGGPEVSYNAEEVLNDIKSVDLIMSGEGEEPFYNLLSDYNRGISEFKIEGIYTRNFKTQPYTNQKEPISPYTDEYLCYLNGRISYIETSRGCPYSCSYCLSGRLCKTKFFNMETVKDNISLLQNSGSKTIKFVDRTFNCNPKRAAEIIDYIIENNPIYTGICFHFELAGDILTDELINSLNKAPKGLIQIEVGVQSFNEETLKAVNRKTDIEKVKFNMARVLEKNNVHTHMDLIAGLPKEDLESFKHSFNSLFALKPHMLQLGFLKLLHGSPMESESYSVHQSEPPYEIIKNKWLSEEDFKKIKYAEDAVDRLYNSGRFNLLTQKAIDKAFENDENPFDMFMKFGMENNSGYKQSLEDFCERTKKYFEKYFDICEINDIMKLDYIRHNPSKLPGCIREENSGKLIKMLDKVDGIKRKKAVKRSAVYLKTENKIAWVDYENKDPVTGLYKLNKIDASSIDG